jgi:hypothetical protein
MGLGFPLYEGTVLTRPESRTASQTIEIANTAFSGILCLRHKPGNRLTYTKGGGAASAKFPVIRRDEERAVSGAPTSDHLTIPRVLLGVPFYSRFVESPLQIIVGQRIRGRRLHHFLDESPVGLMTYAGFCFLRPSISPICKRWLSAGLQSSIRFFLRLRRSATKSPLAC